MYWGIMIIFVKFYTYEGYGEEEINESRDEIVLYHPDANITMEARLETEYKLYIQRR